MSGLTNFSNALEFKLNQRSIKEYSTWEIWPVAKDMKNAKNLAKKEDDRLFFFFIVLTYFMYLFDLTLTELIF